MKVLRLWAMVFALTGTFLRLGNSPIRTGIEDSEKLLQASALAGALGSAGLGDRRCMGRAGRQIGMPMQSPHRCGDSDVTQHATAHMYSHVCYIVCVAASFSDVWGERVCAVRSQAC